MIQSGYRILVASTPEKLAQNLGDLWDSGQVTSNQSAQIVYSGTPLRSREQAWWKVQIWDGNKASAGWSEQAHWSIGLTAESDWKANWIGFDAPSDSTFPREAEERLLKQNWALAPWPADKLHPQTAYFRNEFTIPDGAKITKVSVHLSPDQSCEVAINEKIVGSAKRWELADEIDATRAVHSGDNVATLTIAQEDGYAPAVLGEIVIELDGQAPKIIPVDHNWMVLHSPEFGWQAAGFKSSTGAYATESKNSPWGTPTSSLHQLTPVPFLRTEFTVSKPIRRATLYSTALGIYEFHLNGQKVGNDVLTPGWTDFRHRVHYQTYDVAPLLHEGVNAAGVILGDGWFASALSFTGKRNFYGGYPRVKAQLEIEYTDGSSQTVATNGDWKAATGPLRHADIWLGSEYDGSRELPGWDQPKAQGEWLPVTTGLRGTDNADPAYAVDETKLKVEAQPSEPARELEVLPVRAVTEPQPHVYVFDLGQNMVGWARLHLKGKSGQKVTVRYGEMLDPDGMVYTSNLRGAIATDIFRLKGGDQTLQPLFTFHGFRYVEVLGLDASPAKHSVEGVVVHSDITSTGSFECSNAQVNQLVSNIIWGQKGNYLYIPTDCPQRDERLGWTGDTQFFIRTGTYNYDVAGFFTDWLVTMCEDSQHPPGDFAHVSPDVLGGVGATAWGDAALTCTFNISKIYGDTRIITDHWAALNRYMDWLASKTDAKGISHVGGFGDWLNKGGGASAAVIDTAYHAYLAGIMAEMAQAIGKTSDANRYQALHDQIKTAFIHSFVQSDGRIQDSSQTGFALAYTMGLVPPDMNSKMADQFVADIEKKDWHLATGFIGTPRLLPGLHLAGHDEAAYRLLLQDSYPSWLFQVKLGATTMWERWDGWTPDKGFQDIGMNSFNHYAFGSVGEYLYRYVAGIDTDGPGYRRITIQPQPEAGLSYAKARYDSINGTITSEWHKLDHGLRLTVSIPPNTTAVIRIPASKEAKISEDGRPAGQANSVSLKHRDEDAAYYEVGSGSYAFETQ